MTQAQAVAFVRRRARKYGLDPEAVLRVARAESGLNPYAVGDNNSSFGLFQLHAGGALPRGRGPDWAASFAGMDYALRTMGGVARGLTGPAAVEALVRRFERPANPDAEIQRALGFNGAPAGASVAPTAFQAPSGGGDAMRQAGINALAGLARNRGRFDFDAFTGDLVAARTQAQQYGGDIVPPSGNNGSYPRTGNKTINAILAAAHSQIGKPYVWGGDDPGDGGFDCSGLLNWAFQQAGIDLPGRLTTQTVLGMGRSVKGQSLKPGDFIVTNGGRHMVMYVGGGKVIAAPHRGAVVQYQPFERFRGDIVDVRRIL